MKYIINALIVIVIASISSLAIGYIWISRDKSPEHPALAHAKLPPLISIGDFWGQPEGKYDFLLSPRGTYLSWITYKGDDKIIHIKNRLTDHIHKIKPEGQKSFSYRWYYDDRHILLQEYKNNRVSLWKIDLENIDSKWMEITPRNFDNWSIFIDPKSKEDKFIVTTYDRSKKFHDLYAVDQDGFNKTLLYKNPGNVLSWYQDLNNKIFLREVEINDKKIQIEYNPNRDDGEWHPLLTITPQDRFSIIGDDGKGGLLAVSNLNRDLDAYVRIDLETGEETILAENPQKTISEAAIALPEKRRLDIIQFGNGYPEYQAVTPLGEKILNLLESQLKAPFLFNIISATKSGDNLIVRMNEQENSFKIFFMDIKKNTIKQLGDNIAEKYENFLAETEVHTIKARDGLDIPILLTRPQGVTTPAPMVTLIHGGPTANDRWGESGNLVQFLTNRGYVVLRVNYRGSTGFGKAFQQAGNRQYGEGMQDDIEDAVKWAIQEKIADKNAIAIMGSSFGGYSAMMGLVRAPDLYAVGISIVGALDIEYLNVHAIKRWGISETLYNGLYGDLNNPKDRAKMHELSPINHIDKIKAPVLLGHGVLDRIVDRAITEKFVRGLKKLNKPYEIYYYEKEGHGFSNWQTCIKFYRKVENFLAKHLGGRSGNFDFAEIKAEYIYPIE